MGASCSSMGRTEVRAFDTTTRGKETTSKTYAQMEG
jgi:hypothetical protein